MKELARSYLTVSKDLVRVITRLKALYRSWAIPCSGKQVYAVRHRSVWLNKIGEAGVRRRAEFYYQQLDALRSWRREVRRDLLTERPKPVIFALLLLFANLAGSFAVDQWVEHYAPRQP